MGLVLWTVYEHPRDYPDNFVVRAWLVDGRSTEPTAFAKPLLCDTLKQAREAIPKGLTCIARQPGDDPVITEVWI